MTLRARLARLERDIGRRCKPEDCPGGVTLVLTHGEGEPPPEVPEDALACPLCGEPHVLILVEKIVTAPGAEPAPPAKP
jgi:hypothetical protein